ncbi:MAG TPA: tetratricopeptide repeat protein [Candidatus Sulfotelmatobacter sp.]|nr:tetratricopeptide repeat protein [Candidatus Sulfotelmatobacter sp.]
MRSGFFSAPNSSRYTSAVRNCFLASSIVLFPLLAAYSQSDADANDPRVMQLYMQAKSAEQSGDIAGAVSKYQSILKVAPHLGPAYNNLGALYLRQQQYTKAIVILKQGLELDRSMYSATILLGIAYYETGDYREARQPLEEAVRANPKDNNAELYLAKDLIKLEDFGPAATHLQELTKREPQNQEAWYMLGKVYIQLSEAALAKVDAIDPNSVLSHEIRGDVMASMKNFDGALVEYKKAVDLAPQESGTHYKLGDAYWQLEDWADATEQFQAELINDPGNCNARWKLGDILLERHIRPEEALDDINKALEICPSLKQAIPDRATALIRLNRYEDAMPDLKTAIKGDPNEPRFHFMLAQAYRGLGRTADASAEMATFGKLEEDARAAQAKHAEEVMQQKSKIPDTPQP